MKIYTYHEYIPEMPNGDSLLELWKSSWEKAGWEPVVLGREDAQKHSKYEEYFERYKNLPTSNCVNYEVSCYLRWLALSVVGGGWMSDADVIPYNFKPVEPPSDSLAVWSYNGICPCLVSGKPEHYDYAAKIFAEWEGPYHVERGVNHISDQNILGQIDRFFHHIPICANYGDIGWEYFSVVHYPNSRMQDKSPRKQYIPQLRSL